MVDKFSEVKKKGGDLSLCIFKDKITMPFVCADLSCSLSDRILNPRDIENTKSHR